MDERQSPWTTAWQSAHLFAFVEQREGSLTGETVSAKTFVLDVVRAQDLVHLLAGGAGARAELPFVATAQIVVTVPLPLPEQFDALVEGTWHQIRTGEREEFSCTIYRDLDAAELLPTKLTVDAPLLPDVTAALLALVSLDDTPTATTPELLTFSSATDAAYVAVMHVGQGNCNAVCNAQGAPIFYFDLGAGCLQNTHTRPVPLRFCFTQQPWVVLSHWDFDHWYGATLPGQAVPPVNWLAPSQAIGVRTRKFAAGLIARGLLRLWPAAQRTVVNAPVELAKCGGASKNDSGLALTVGFHRRGAVMCPADATFDHIPVPRLGRGRPLAGLVATHHGSAHIGAPIPRPAPTAKLAFSFGTGNSFGHPGGSRTLYAAEGWTAQLDSPNGGIALGGRARRAPCGNQCEIGTTQQ